MSVLSTAAPPRLSRREFSKAIIDRAIKQALRPLRGKLRRAFVQLLSDVQARSDLFRPSFYEGRVTAEAVAPALNGLVALAAHRRVWLRPVDGWEPPPDAGPFDTFSSLAHHLAANYPVPPVLVAGWFLGSTYPARSAQAYFLRAGQGESLRRVNFPVALTKRMAAELWNAPRDLPLRRALCWAQVKGMGGADDRARVLAESSLSNYSYPFEFWPTVVRFFVNQGPFDHTLIDPIVVYLNDQKYDGVRVTIDDDTDIEFDPPQPDLTMKGRTLAALARQALAWRDGRAAREAAAVGRTYSRPRAPVAEYVAPRDDGRAWTVRQLLDGESLIAEAKAMRHCVATYIPACLAGRSSVWSLGIEGADGTDRERVATVAVHPAHRELLHAKGVENAEPGPEALAVIHAWADREGLGKDFLT